MQYVEILYPLPLLFSPQNNQTIFKVSKSTILQSTDKESSSMRLPVGKGKNKTLPPICYEPTVLQNKVSATNNCRNSADGHKICNNRLKLGYIGLNLVMDVYDSSASQPLQQQTSLTWYILLRNYGRKMAIIKHLKFCCVFIYLKYY